MVRSVLSVAALVGLLAAMQPAAAEPLTTPAANPAAAATLAPEQTAPPPARPSSPDAQPPTGVVGKDIAFVGFGWG